MAITQLVDVEGPRPDPAALSNFESWIGHQAGTAPLTSAKNTSSLPFQRWFRFKEAFSPRFVVDALHEHAPHARTCLDPFGGSGTTAVTCQFLGIRPTAIEVNPFLADLIESKLASYDIEALLASRMHVARIVTANATTSTRRASRTNKHQLTDFFPGAPDIFVEPGRDGRWVFDASVACRIAAYRDVIDSLDYEPARRLLRVVLGSMLVSLSNVVISGKARRYRQPSRRHTTGPQDVDARFDDAFRNAFYDICRYRRRAEPAYTLLRGDSRELVRASELADVVLFSPPYPNSFDYTDIYNVELWALGYLTSAGDNRALRSATLRSHVQIKGRFDAAPPDSTSLRTRAGWRFPEKAKEGEERSAPGDRRKNSYPWRRRSRSRQVRACLPNSGRSSGNRCRLSCVT